MAPTIMGLQYYKKDYFQKQYSFLFIFILFYLWCYIPFVFFAELPVIGKSDVSKDYYRAKKFSKTALFMCASCIFVEDSSDKWMSFKGLFQTDWKPRKTEILTK